MLKQLLKPFSSPISSETKTLLAKRWAALPESLKSPKQVVGQHWVQCGFITGPSYCSFGCTHCYLPKNANLLTPPSVQEVKEQLDANRKILGPGGPLQVTGGDVVDAYLKTNRFDDLIELVRYTNEIGLVPMLMTHGQTLLEKPQRLHRLVLEGGLRKISFHIDMTQAGRARYPIKGLVCESDLNPLRDQFTDLILSTRKLTGKRLVGAQTITVTQRNIDSIGDVITWQMASTANMSAFSTISFQPEADVGRTRFSQVPVTPQLVWQKVQQVSGKNLIRDALHFGHPDCSSIAMLVVDTKNKLTIDILPKGEVTAEFWGSLLKAFGGLGGRGNNKLFSALSKMSVIAKNPSIMWKILRYIVYLLRRESTPLSFFLSALTGNVGAFKIVMHNFIDSSRLENPDEVIQARLNACSFQGAIKIDGQWKATPMCMTNAKFR